MFIGAIPKQVAEQIVTSVPFGDWGEIYLCCSGSFRMEQAIGAAFPHVPIHSNDVSLYSTAIGQLALQKPITLTFRSRLAFVEDLLKGADFLTRVSAVLVAHDMSKFVGKNEYAKKHFSYYEIHFAELLEKAVGKLTKVMPEIRIAEYFAGDWRLHAEQAIKAGAGIAAFPPFFMGDYEKQYAFLEDSIAWEAPSYDLYDPKQLDGLLTHFEETGTPYCVVSDQLWEHRKPVMEYVTGRKKPHYGYWSGRSSVRHIFNKPQPFRYKPIEVSKITAASKITITLADAKHMNFLKDVYLAKGIIHSTGMMNFMIFIDGMLVGGIIYALAKYGNRHSIYLLSDVTISSEGKLSKLVALIATSRTLVRLVEKKVMDRIDEVVTTARSKNAVSMKYRDIYELASRRPSDVPEEGNILQYHSAVREQTPQELFEFWHRKYHVSKQPTAKRQRRGRGDSRRSGDEGLQDQPEDT
jgi:hypothetical protein